MLSLFIRCLHRNGNYGTNFVFITLFQSIRRYYISQMETSSRAPNPLEINNLEDTNSVFGVLTFHFEAIY